MVRDRGERPQEDSLTVHCYSMCDSSALLGDLLGVSRSVESYCVPVLSIYHRIFLGVFITLDCGNAIMINMLKKILR